MTETPSPTPIAATVTAFMASIVRELRWRLAGAAVVAVALAFAEGAGLLMLIPLLASIGLSVDEGPTSGLAAAIEWGFAAAGLRPRLITVLGVFLLVSIAHALLYRAHLMLNPVLEQRYGLALRRRLYSAIVAADWSFLMRHRMADLVHAATTDVDRTSSAAYQALTLLTGLVVSAVYVAIAFRLSPMLTALVAAAGVVMLWASRRRTQRSDELGERYSDANRRQFHMTSESIAGLKVAKSFGAERRDIVIFARYASARAEAYLDLLRSFARAKMGLDLSSALLMSGLLLVAVEWLQLRGAGLLMLVFVFARVMPRMMSLQASTQTVIAGLPSFRLVMRLIDECEARSEHLGGSVVERATVRGEVRFDNVAYSYHARGAPVLHAVSLSIPAGRTTGVVGASGAGKSTMADVLLGLLRPTSGRVVIDGRPLVDSDIAAWRRAIGYVPQDSFLLHDSVRVNLLWAKPDATEAEMWDALDRAGAAAFVRVRPEGLDAVVGDRGIRLSGGERQRLALARALLTQPDLLVLDEATSALDSVNEQQILRAVHDVTGRVTTVIITHRLSAIRHADVIHVLDEGHLVESGTWPALAARQGVFAKLLRAQGLDNVTVVDQGDTGAGAASRTAI